MDYIGLLSKYKINRPLTEEEHAHQLRQDKKLDVEPLYQLSVIGMNSTYMELVDKFYAWKGFVTLVTTMIIGVIFWFLLSMTAIGLDHIQSGKNELVEELLFLGVFYLMFTPLLIASIWILRKEIFRYTQYPIRLNRKTRTVHVFRLDGTVLSVPWDDVFFTLGASQTSGIFDLVGHVLDADRTVVLETFSLGQYGSLTKEDLANPARKDENYLHRYWEFVRRYMEEGPRNLIKQVEYLVPVAEQKESVGYSFSRFNANWGPLWIPMLPLTLLVWPFRVLAMRTCKIPQWPQEIENECAVDENDRFRRDEAHPNLGDAVTKRSRAAS